MLFGQAEPQEDTDIGCDTTFFWTVTPRMRFSFFFLILGLLTSPVDAQTIWSRPYEPNQFAVEVLVPESPDETSATTGATFFTGTFSLNDNVELATELPVARYGASANGASSATTVGNPYIGLGFSSTTLPFLFELGARFPATESNDAARIGRASDVGRTNAFRSDEFVLSGLLNTRISVGNRTSLRLRSGFGLGFIDQGEETTQDWRLQYDTQLWREAEWTITGLSFSGRALLGPGETQHHAVFSVMGNWDRIQPGLVAGTSLNDLVNEGTFTPFAGLTLSISYLR